MFEKILIALGYKLIEAVGKAVLDWLKIKAEEQKLKKQVKEKLIEIRKDPDRVNRAKRLRDFLNKL